VLVWSWAAGAFWVDVAGCWLLVVEDEFCCATAGTIKVAASGSTIK
jgi:hypothetical protein